MLTPPNGQDLRLTSGQRLTPAFGLNVGGRRPSYDLPMIGSPEHTALMSGSLDLSELERSAGWPAADFGPTAGDFGPTDFGPAGGFGPAIPAEITASWLLPSSRMPAPQTPATPALDRGPALDRPTTDDPVQLRTPARPRAALRLGPAGPIGKPLSGAVLAAAGPLPMPRAERDPLLPIVGGAPFDAFRPAVTPTSGALRLKDVEEALAATGPITLATCDPTPTGELVRPFIDDAVLDDGSPLDSVPPPVSVDVFQRSVQAGLKRDPAAPTRTDGCAPVDEELDVDVDDDADTELPTAPVTTRRAARWEASPLPTRRQRRDKERAYSSPRAVTARRLAKGGVLAITALGVVGTVAPQALVFLGVPLGSGPASRGALDFTGAFASAGPVAQPASPAQLAQNHELATKIKLRTEIAAQVADDVTHAALGAGGALIDLAQQADAAADARHKATILRAARDAARDPRGYAAKLVMDAGWGDEQFRCLDSLWTRESNWDLNASNPSSGAYGIAQALPGSKMASVGADWRTNPITQMKWGINYITERYGTPCGAWAHSQSTGWY